jgi:hydroxymethylpyrimidine pyrophosphatase-like HAD family hydrolase
VTNEPQAERPKAVIVDCDGTLVDVSSVRHYVDKPKGEKNFDAFHAESIDCPPVQQALDFCQRWRDEGHVVLVVTARVHKWFYTTLIWLEENMTVPYEGPFMRQDNDFRPDVQIKREIFDKLVKDYDIVAACDDNPNVIELWEEKGLAVEIIPGWDESFTVKGKVG